MKVLITLYKPNGKYYATGIAEEKGFNPNVGSDEFLQFVKRNLPAHYFGGYVVVQDVPPVPVDEFHNCLIKFDDLFPVHLGARLCLTESMGDIPANSCVEVTWLDKVGCTIRYKDEAFECTYEELEKKSVPCRLEEGGCSR